MLYNRNHFMHQSVIFRKKIPTYCLEGSSFEYFHLSDIKITDTVDRGELTKFNPFKSINYFLPHKHISVPNLQDF